MKVYAASKLLDRREFGVGKRLRPTMSSYERLDEFLIKFGGAGSILLRWVGRLDEGTLPRHSNPNTRAFDGWSLLVRDDFFAAASSTMGIECARATKTGQMKQSF